jgi:uncharacterized cupin superfamily protein
LPRTWGHPGVRIWDRPEIDARHVPKNSKNSIRSDEGGSDMEITVQKLSSDELKERDVFSWPIWEKEASKFDWQYHDIEECFFLAGKVTVETKDGKKVSFGKGDFVTFPKGLSCVWNIKEAVRKHYNFR